MLGLGTGAPIVQVYHEKSVVLPDVSRVLACLYEKDVKFETHTASYKSLLRLQASSHAPVPFYDGPTFLEESREICRYVAEKYEDHGYPFLLGKDALERASVEQWLHNEEHAFNPPSRALFCHLAFPLDEEDDGDDIYMHARKLEEVLEVYEQRLSDSEFLAGNKFTLADLVHLPNSHYIKASNKFLYLYDSRKNVKRWWDTISARDSWKKVLSYMERVEEQNKQEELKKKQQQQQKEHPRISPHPIRIDPQKKISTEPRTILVAPPDTVLSSPRFPQKEEPPTDTFPNEALVSSSQSIPTADKTSVVFTTPQETPPTSVRSTPATSKEYLSPVQTTKGTTSPTTAKKPSITDAAKSITKDVSILEPTENNLPSRHAPTSSEDVPNNLDVLDYYPNSRYTDEETPYIKPTPRKTSEMLDTFAGSKTATGHTKTSSISAKEEPDQPSATDFYKSDIRATSVDSHYKESVPNLEPTDTSAGKLHTTDVHRRLQTEQWHTATTGLSDLKQDTTEDHHSATSAIQEKHTNVEDTAGISRDASFEPKQMIAQDDQDTFKETKSGGSSLFRDQQLDTRQAASTLPEHEVNQDGRSVAPPFQTRYPSSTPSKTRFQIAKDASKQPRGTSPPPKKKAAQDDNQTYEESNTADEVASTEQPLNAWREPISPRRQEVQDSSTANTSFQKIYPDEEEDMQVADTASTSRQITPDGGKAISEETKLADSTTASAEPLYTQRTSLPRPRQAEVKDAQDEGRQTRYPSSLPRPRQAEVEDAQDKGRQIRVTIPESHKMVARDAQDTHGERRKTSAPREQSSDLLQAIPQSRPAAPQDVHSETGETTMFPEILDTKRSRDTFEATKDPDSTLPRAQSLGARDSQSTNGESRASGADQRKDVSRQLQPDAQDPFQLSKLSAIDQKGWGSLSSQERDAKDAQATMSERKSVSTEKHRELIKREPRAPVKVEGVSSIYQKQPPFAQDNQEQAQIIEADEKTNGSRPKHQRASDVLYTLDEKLNTTAPANAKTSYDFSAADPYRKDATDDQKYVPPLLSKESTSQAQPTSESLQEAGSRGGLSTKPSTIEQWQRASVPLNDVTPMSQHAAPSAEHLNQVAKESGEQSVELPVPTEVKTSGVQSVSPSFPGASSADVKFAKQSIIDERVGEPTKMQASTPDSAPADTKRATPDGHEIGDSELLSTHDGQIPEAANTRHDQATLQEVVHDPNLPTHDVAKDTFKETKVADFTPSSAKPIYTQRSAPTPRLAEAEDTRDKVTKSRQTLPDRQKMVERRPATTGEQVSEHLKAMPPSRQAPAEDALGATGDTIQSPDILYTSKKFRGTYQEAKGPGSRLSKAQSLGAQDAQGTTGESTTPTAGQRKNVSTKPQPDFQDGFKESKLSAPSWNGLGSLASEGKDIDTTIAGEKSFSTEQLRETSKSETTTPKEHRIDSQVAQDLNRAMAPDSIYKKPLVAQDNQKYAQAIPVGEKADGSTPKHQQASDAPNIFDDKLNASQPARPNIHDDFNAEEPYREDTADDQKVAPPLLSRKLTSQVQPPSKPSQNAALHGDLSSEPSTIGQWQRASAPLHDMATRSGDDEVAMPTINQKLTPMRQQESGEQRVESPVPTEAETSGVQRASPSFPGASVDDHATIGDKYAKQSIIDERVGKPIQILKSTADAHPSSEATRTATPGGHASGGLGLVSTPDGQISEATKARDDPARVHEDVYDVNLSTHDVGEDTFKGAKVADSTSSSAKPMYTQQPAITPSRQTQVEEARDKNMQSRETIPEQQKMVERKTDISEEQSPDHQKAIPPSRQAAAAEDAPAGDTIQPSYIPDSSKKSRGTFGEAIHSVSTLPKAKALDAQDSQLTKGESTIPTADKRKDWKDTKDDETIMTEEKSFSAERLREMFKESESTTPKTQLTDSQGNSMVDKSSPIYQKEPFTAQESQEKAQIIPAGEKLDTSKPDNQKSSGAPYTYDKKLSASAPARADIRDDHSAEESYRSYNVDDQKVAPSPSSKEPASQVQPLSLQRAVPDGDSPSKSFSIESIDQWQHASAPLHGVSTDSGDAEVAMDSNNDQKSVPTSQEATLSSPTSDVVRTAPSLPEAARADDVIMDDKFAKQPNIDERVGAPKLMQEPITAAHPSSTSTKRKTLDDHEDGGLKLVKTPGGQRLEAAKATQDSATLHEDVHDAAIDEKTATYQVQPPASTQAQPTVETPHHSDSSPYSRTGDSGTELAKPIVTDQEAVAPIAGPTSMDTQRAATSPTEVADSQQKSAPSDKGSARAAHRLSPVEPIRADSNVSAADYSNAPQMIFQQQAIPSPPSTTGIPASDTQGVIGKIQEVTPENRRTDDSGKRFVPSQNQVSHASQTIPGQVEMTFSPDTTVSPTSDTQLASTGAEEVSPNEQQTVESITPLFSSGKQGSHVGYAFGPGEVGPADNDFVPSDQKLPRPAEQPTSSKPRKEQTVVPTAEQIKEQPTIIGQQDIPYTREALTSKDEHDTTPTHGDVHPTGSIKRDRRPLSVQGEEPTSATEAPPPRVAKDSLDTEDISTDALGNVQSLKPSTTPDARGVIPGGLEVAEQKSSPSGQDSADPAEPAFSLGPRDEEIRDSTPSALPISSTDPSKGDSTVAVPDQAKDSQTPPSQQEILSTQRPSGKVQENIPGQDSAYFAQPPLSVEPRSKEIGNLAPSTQLNSTIEPRNGDAIVAAPHQAKDSQTTPGRQVKLSTPSSYTQHPLGTLQEDVPADDSGEAKSSKPPSLVREGKTAAALTESAPDRQQGAAPDQVAVDEQKFALSGQSSASSTFPAPAPGTQYGTELHKADVDGQKFPSSDQDSVHSVQPSFSTEQTKEDTVAAATDQTSTLEKIIDQNDTTPAPDKAKTPFLGSPDVSRETQKSTDDDHIDQKLPGQGRVSPYRDVSEPPKGPTPEEHIDIVDKETTLGSSQAETSNTRPDSTPIGSNGRLSSSDMPAASSLPETQDLQGSAYAQSIRADYSGNIESPGHLSTDQMMAPIMSPSVPSVAPLGTVPDQELGHTPEPPSSVEPRKEKANAAPGVQPNVPQGPKTTVQHQVREEASLPDATEASRKDQQPSHAVLPEQTTHTVLPSNISGRPTPEVGSTVVDKEATLLSSLEKTSPAEPDSTPISGDVSPTSSLQNQDVQPPVTTQAQTTQSLQGSTPRQASPDQAIAPVTSSAVPQSTKSDQDSTQSLQPPFSAEPTENNTAVTAPDRTMDMETTTHPQAITPAPDTVKTPFPGSDQEAVTSIAGPTSIYPQLAGTLPAGVAHSKQILSEKGSARGAQPLSPIEPIKPDSNISAANYTNAQQINFRQQARPSAASTIGIPASETHGVIGKIQEGIPDNHRTDDSGKPSVPNQKQISHESQAIHSQEEMASPPGATVYPNSATQLASAEVQEVSRDDQQAVESIIPLFSSGKQGSRVESAFEQDQEPQSAEQPTSSGKPSKEQSAVPTAEKIKEHPTIIGQHDTPDTREVRTSEDVLDTTPTHGDVHPTGSIKRDRRPLSVQGEELTSATEAPPPRVAKDSLDTEDISTDALGNVQSLKPSTTPDARGIIPGGLEVAEQKSSPSGQDSADPAEPAFSLGPRDEEIRDSTPSALVISSTDPSKGDSTVAVPDQAKDSQTPSSQQEILSTQRPSGKVQENIPGQDSGYSVQPSSSAEPRSKEIGDLDPSTQLNSTTDPRNEAAIVAAPDQDKVSRTTPGKQDELSAPSSYTGHPSGIHQEDEPADDLGEAMSSKPPSVSALDTQRAAAQDQVAVDDEKFALLGQGSAHSTFPAPAPAPGTQYGAELHKEDVDGPKFSPSDQDAVHSVQPSFSTEPTKEDTVVAATDQTSTLEKIIDDNDKTPAPDKEKTPFLGTPDASRETQKITDDDRIDEELTGQGRISSYRDAPMSPEGPTPAEHSDVDKEATAGSRPAGGDAHLSSGDVPAAIALPQTQDLQGSAYVQNVPTGSLGKIESPGHLSTDQTMKPRISPAVPSDAPQGTIPGTISVQPPQQASMASTLPDTQHGILQGKATPAEQKISISDQEPTHTLEPPSSADEPRKEEANAAAGDQPNVPQGLQTMVRHQPSPDPRKDLRKDPQPSHDDDHISNSANPFVVSEGKASHALHASEGPSSEVSSAVVDKKMTLPSIQTQTSSTGVESTPISGDSRLSNVDVLATSSLPNEEVHTPAATQVPTPQAPLDSASTQNVPADSLGESSSAALSEAPQDQVSAHASEPPFSVEPRNEASHAGHASESHEGITPEVRSPVVDAKTEPPSRQVHTATTGPESSPISGDVLNRSSLRNKEAQHSAGNQAPTVQGQGSASTKNEPADSLGDIKSPIQFPTDEVVAPITSFATPSTSSQATGPGTNSVQTSEEASFDYSSGEKPTRTHSDQAKTLPNVDFPTSVVGQSESSDSKGMDSQENFEGASTDENPKQQTAQVDSQSFKDENNEADETVRSNMSTTFEDLPKQPSWPKGRMELSDEPDNQQHTDQAIEGNGNETEQTKAHDTETGEPEDMEASENTNQKLSSISQVEAFDHSRKEASRVQRLGQNTKDAPNSGEDAPGDVQAVSKSKEILSSSEEAKVQLQSEDESSGTVAPSSKTGQPGQGDLPANSYQNNSSQSQLEASDKSDEQYSGNENQNKDRDTSRLDDSVDPTKPSNMED